MREAILIFLGWLLGLLGHPIVSRIEKYYKRKDIQIAVFSELKNLAVRLTATCCKIQMHLGRGDKTILKWLKTTYEKYRADCPPDVLEVIDKLLEAPDDQFNASRVLSKADENTKLGLKTFSLPFTESILADLSVFDSEFQREILEIRTRVDMLNEEVDSAVFYYRLTFDPSCMSTNENIISQNLNNAYDNIQRGCRIIVDKIDKLLSCLQIQKEVSMDDVTKTQLAENMRFYGDMRFKQLTLLITWLTLATAGVVQFGDNSLAASFCVKQVLAVSAVIFVGVFWIMEIQASLFWRAHRSKVSDLWPRPDNFPLGWMNSTNALSLLHLILYAFWLYCTWAWKVSQILVWIFGVIGVLILGFAIYSYWRARLKGMHK